MKPVERVKALAAGKAVDRLPFMPFTMQFAGDFIGCRYLDYMTDPEVHAEGQIRTAEAFGCDHVSITSDPTVQPGDFGAKVRFFERQPAAIDESEPVLSDKAALARLKIPDPLGPGRMKDTVRLVGIYRKRVGGERLIEGWVEGPCALASCLRGINILMTDFFDDPGFVKDLFAMSVEASLAFARAEVDAGADLIGLGDAAASLVGPRIYEDFVWAEEKRLVEGLHALGVLVRLHICGDTRRIVPLVGRLGCDIVDLDSQVPVDLARAGMGPQPILLGNLDPVRTLRDGTPESILKAVEDCHRKAGSRFIVGAGCEVPRDTPHANLRAMGDYARSHR